jgi:hypothetical protein
MVGEYLLINIVRVDKRAECHGNRLVILARYVCTSRQAGKNGYQMLAPGSARLLPNSL